MLFALHALVSDDGDLRPDRIVVSEADQAGLARTFERTWQRPPTDAELRDLVEDFVTEEILYREALALGLDRDDLVVRRRMRQKMEFLSAGLADEADPSEEDLVAHLRAHPEQFEEPARTSFEQLFVDTSSHRAGPGSDAPSPEERAAAILRRLEQEGGPDAPVAELGDPTLLPRRLDRARPDEIADRFGPAFTESVATLPIGKWAGPLRSPFGLHLVRVASRVPAQSPTLEVVRAEVEREWRAARRDDTRERFHEALREGYEIVVPKRMRGDESRTADTR